jgi:hypothetical protein
MHYSTTIGIYLRFPVIFHINYVLIQWGNKKRNIKTNILINIVLKGLKA